MYVHRNVQPREAICFSKWPNSVSMPLENSNNLIRARCTTFYWYLRHENNGQVGDLATMLWVTLAPDFCQSLIANEIPFHIVQEESDYIIEYYLVGTLYILREELS